MKIEDILDRFKKNDKDLDAFSANSRFLDFMISTTFTFLDGLNNSTTLDKQWEPIIRVHVISNYLANIVTCIEIYFKVLIQQYNNWDEEGYKKLFKEKITLSDAFDLFSKHKVTRQFIISEHYSFQNLTSIDNVLSNLTGDSKILEKIEIFETEMNKVNGQRTKKRSSLIETNPEWRKAISILFELRHTFIHEGKTTVTDRLIAENYSDIVLNFQTATDDFFRSRYYDPLNIEH